MWDLNTIRRLNGETTAPEYRSASPGVRAYRDDRGRLYLRGEIHGRKVNMPVPEHQLPPGVTIVGHS